MLEGIRLIWCWIITSWDYLVHNNSLKEDTKEMGIDQTFYNEPSAINLGWDPSWFGQKYFDEQPINQWWKKF